MSSSSGGEEAEPVPRVLVIGLDGAGFEILEPLMKEKRIPNITNLINEGCSGLFESTIPPVTIPAWVSMLTGKNPGKIGCFDLLKQVGYLSEPSNSCFQGNTPIWQILNKYGIKTGLMNVPGTYPPETIDGFIVTGMMTPSNTVNTVTLSPYQVNSKKTSLIMRLTSLNGTISMKIGSLKICIK